MAKMATFLISMKTNFTTMKNILITILVCLGITSFAQEKGMLMEHDANWKQILEKAKKEIHFSPRPASETINDTVNWQYHGSLQNKKS